MRRTRCILIAVALTVAGCGSVDWFPAYHRQPTTPDQFSFPTKTGVAVGTAVTSDPITVAGLTADTTPISVSGAAGSQYTVNTTAATSEAGTVKNGDTVTVTHTSAAAVGTPTVSTLSIGDMSATFTSVTGTTGSTATVNKTGAPGAIVPSGAQPLNVIAGVRSVSISNGSYSLDNTTFTTVTQSLSLTNQQNIFLRNTAAINIGGTVSTILSIDNVPTIIFITTTQ
jgi:hypothetical protein